MRKLFLLILLVVLYNTSFGQFPNSNGVSNSNTQYYSKGGLGSDSGFVFRTNFADTTALNRGWLDGISGNLVRVGDNLYLRNNAGTLWQKLTFSVTPSPSDTTGVYWPLGYKYFPVVQALYPPKIGTASADAFTIGTNATDRLIFAANGLSLMTAADDSVLVRSAAGVLGLAPRAGISTPTWQQTLTAGSTLNVDNSVSIGTNYFETTGTGVSYGIYPSTKRFYVYNVNGSQNVTFQVDPSNFMTTLSHSYGNEYLHLTKESGWQDLLLESATTTTANLKSGTYKVELGTNDTRFFTDINNIIAGYVYNHVYMDSTGIQIGTKKLSGATYKGITLDLNHQIYFDSLLNLSTQDRLVGIRNSTGQIGNITLGSGLSLSSGVLNTSGTVATPISSLTNALAGNNLTNNADYPQSWLWPTFTGSNGAGLSLGANTTSTTDVSPLFEVAVNGANAASNVTSYAAQITNQHTGTNSTNYALNVVAGSGTTNIGLRASASGGYAIIVPPSSGSVGIGTSAPTSLLHVNGVTQMGTAGSTLGQILISGNTSGTITLQPAAAAGTYTLTLPTTDGNASEFLQTDGSGILTWAAASGGVTALAAIGASPNANGATISGSTLNLEPASASFGGVVTTGTQTFAGAKTFSSFPTISAATSGRVPYFTTSGLITDASTLTYDGADFLSSGTGSGNVGLAARNTTSTGRATLKMGNDNSSIAGFIFINGTAKTDYGGAGSLGFLNINNAAISFHTNNVDLARLYIGGAGQIGLQNESPTSYFHLAAGTTAASTSPLKFTTGTSMTSAEAGAVEYTTPQLFFTNGRAVRQEIPQIQQARVSTQYDNTTTTLGNVTGLTTNVAASGTYRFEARLYTTSNVSGGIKVAIGGTATATAIVYEGLTTDGGLITQSRSAALGTAVGAVTAVTAAYVVITGTITVNAAGTLTVQAAANAAVGTTSVLVGSTFVITEML